MIGLTGEAGIMRGGWMLLAAGLMLAPGAAKAQEATEGTAGPMAEPRIVLPLPDAERGKFLFVAKGCVVCHSVNGVGGTAAPALDAAGAGDTIDPLEFAARMWRGAVAMTVLQSTEFGYQIDMTGEEIADLAAFAADPALQATFSERDIPEVMRGWTLEQGWEEQLGDLPAEMPSGEAQ